MTVLIIDDERLARKELDKLLESYDGIEVIGEAIDADDAFEKINLLNPEIIFLDIQMPGKTGFDPLERLESSPKVIFTTAYDEFALKAFDVNALDYLLKPIQPARLNESINKLVETEAEKPTEHYSGDKKLTVYDQVFVKDGDKCWFVKLSSIRLFESDGNYIKIYFDNLKPMIHKSLNTLDKKLDDRSFFRASRKYIVNLSWVEDIEPWLMVG